MILYSVKTIPSVPNAPKYVFGSTDGPDTRKLVWAEKSAEQIVRDYCIGHKIPCVQIHLIPLDDTEHTVLSYSRRHTLAEHINAKDGVVLLPQNKRLPPIYLK